MSISLVAALSAVIIFIISDYTGFSKMVTSGSSSWHVCVMYFRVCVMLERIQSSCLYAMPIVQLLCFILVSIT